MEVLPITSAVLFKSFQFIGLLPFSYSPRTSQFKQSQWCSIFNLTALVFVGISYPIAIFSLISQITLEYVTGFLKLAVIYIGVLFYFSFLVIYVLQLLNRDRMITFMNKCMKFKSQFRLIVNIDNFYNPIMLFSILFKVIVIEGSLIVVLMGMIHTYIVDLSWRMTFAMIIFFITSVSGANISNLFFVTILHFHRYYELLNQQVERTIADLSHANSQCVNKHELLKMCCEVSDRLDEINYVQMKLYKLTKTVSELLSFSLFVVMGGHFWNVIIQIFFIYAYVYEVYIDDGTPLTTVWLSSLVHLLGSFFSIFVQVVAAATLKREAQRTGQLLFDIPFRNVVDDRLRTSIAEITYHMANQSPLVNVSGMFELDYPIVYDVRNYGFDCIKKYLCKRFNDKRESYRFYGKNLVNTLEGDWALK